MLASTHSAEQAHDIKVWCLFPSLTVCCVGRCLRSYYWTRTGVSMQACGCGCPVAPSSSSSSTATVPSALVKGPTPRATLSGTLYMYLSCGHFVVC